MKKKRKVQLCQYIPMLFFIVLGGVCGYLMGDYVGRAGGNGIGFILLLVGMYFAMLLQIIIHEGGHLVFGLISGYGFCSFRIGSFMWLKEGDKLKLKHLSLAGTGGQCLMTPPEIVDGDMPVILYNLGGSILNIISSLIFIVLYLMTKKLSYLPVLCLITAAIGIVFAIMNGVPMRLGVVDNDGYNAWSLSKNTESRRAFWVQLKVNELQAKGYKLRDMPVELFKLPEDEAMKNSMIASVGVFACNRLMDEHRFEEADALMKHYLEMETATVGLHRSLLVCDRVFCELIGENRGEVIEEFLDTQQKKFMKSMKKFPTVIRTEYACSLLYNGDAVKAEKLKARFEKTAKTYPYPCEIASEREYIDLAEKALQT